MKYEISQDRLNEIATPILDEVFGPLHPQGDKNRLFDDEGIGRIHIRRNTPHISPKDFKRLISELDLPPHIWAKVIQHWMKERYDRDVIDEFAWLSYSL
jgi:hypothetical protein